MNKKQKIYVYGGALLVAVGLTVYFLTKDDGDDKITDELKVDEPEVAKQPTNTFADKVKVLQALLGFTGDDVDGIIGDKTRGRLADNGIKTTVTALNIDSITAKLKTDLANKTKAEQEKVAKNVEIQQAKVVTDSRVAQANKIVDALKKSKVLILTWIDKPANMTLYKKDLLGKFIASGTKQIKTNDAIIPKSYTVRKNGFMEILSGDKYLIISPYSVTVF
jgi:hypothetical protein